MKRPIRVIELYPFKIIILCVSLRIITQSLINILVKELFIMLTKLGVLTISVQVKIKCALGTIVKIILVGVRWRDIELFKTLFGLNIKTS